MAKLGVHQISQKEWVHKGALKSNNGCSLKKVGFFQIQENNQVKSLIVGLFDQMMNPAVVSLHSSQTSQMSTHSTDHTRDTSDGL